MGLARCRKIDPQTTEEKIILILTKMVTRLNIDRNMTAMQIQYCAQDIMNASDPFIFNLSLDEISLCMDKGVRGEYGEIYNRMDQAVVFSWLRKYIDEKSVEHAKLQMEVSARDNQNIHELFQNETMQKLLHMVVKSTKIDETKKQKIERNVSDGEILCQEFLLEFDQLYRDQPGRIVGGTRHVVYNDKLVDQSDYVTERFYMILDEPK